MIREQAHSGAEPDCQESAWLCVYFFCAPSSSASPGLPRLGLALLGFLISTHLLCLRHLHTWPTSTPDDCSVKAWSCSLSLPLCCGHFVLGSWELYVWFWAVFRILDHGLHSCCFDSFLCKAILSSTCQSHPALVPFMFSVPQPISPCYTAIHIIFLGHQSVSL